MTITYTFPSDFKIPQLRGITCTGGTFCNAQGRWMDGDNAVSFAAPIVDGKKIIALIAGKPELESLFAEYKMQIEAKKQAEAEYKKTPCGQRDELVAAELNTYSPDNFPGSSAWRRNHACINDLEAFDAAHPELVAELASDREAKAKTDYAALSDFVKSGS
jgi:hypothetical protein